MVETRKARGTMDISLVPRVASVSVVIAVVWASTALGTLLKEKIE